MNPKALSQKEIIEGMIVETLNEITKCEIVDRLQNREILNNVQVAGIKEAQMMNQRRIKQLKRTIKNLNDVLGGAETEPQTVEKILKGGILIE